MAPLHILLTGAAGRIGTILRPALAGRYGKVRLLDRRPVENIASNEEALIGDITDRATLHRAVEGVDAVVHMAGYPRIGDWNEILPLNIAATYELLDASRLAGVKRFVIASSHHAIGYYPRTETVGTDAQVRPDSG